MEDGDQIENAHNYLRKVRSVKTGKIYIDNQINAFVANDVVLDRQNLAENGIVIVVVQIDKAKNAVIGKPRIQTMGIIANKDILSFNKHLEVDYRSPAHIGDKLVITGELVERGTGRALRTKGRITCEDRVIAECTSVMVIVKKEQVTTT